MAEKLDSQQFYFKLGESMRHARKAAGFSKEKVARALGVSLPKYIAMEEGMEEIAMYELYLLMRLLGMSFYDVFPWHE